MAVTTQPQLGYTLAPLTAARIPGVPPGLEYLASVDQLIIKQKIEVMELLTGCETRNKYDIFNSMQQQAYYCYEESETCNRICCGPQRGFIFHIQDNNQREVLTLERPFKCWAGCPCCADGSSCQYPVYIMDGQGQKLGMMRMTNFCCYPHFGIFDNTDTQLYQIVGGCCRCQGPCCKDDVNFPVTSINDGSQVANVAKQWAGTFREMITDADTYNVSFPMDMHVIHKALIFASIFLVDMTLYEHSESSN